MAAHPKFTLPPPSNPLLAFGDQQAWILTTPLVYSIGKTGMTITVPQGFVTDLASVPRELWGPPLYLTPTGQYGRAAIVHDYLYWSQHCSRDQADRLLVIAMKESGVGTFDEVAIYAGVHVGGQSAWDNNAKDKAAGLPRILPPEYQHPADPNIHWPEYAKQLMKQGVASVSFPDDGGYCIFGNSLVVP